MKCKGFSLILVICLAFCVIRPLSAQQASSREAVRLVSNLYRQVIARHPTGIPAGGDLKVFAPYLSSSLLHRMEQYRACTSDWDRKNAGSNLKSPVGLFENDIFSGAYEEASPQTFRVEKSYREVAGHWRVNVRLTSGSAPAGRIAWNVAAIVSQERGRFVVDDIVYTKDNNRSGGEMLTEYFSRYCDGSTYVGRR